MCLHTDREAIDMLNSFHMFPHFHEAADDGDAVNRSVRSGSCQKEESAKLDAGLALTSVDPGSQGASKGSRVPGLTI